MDQLSTDYDHALRVLDGARVVRQAFWGLREMCSIPDEEFDALERQCRRLVDSAEALLARLYEAPAAGEAPQ
jgi:hypothetical protein